MHQYGSCLISLECIVESRKKYIIYTWVDIRRCAVTSYEENRTFKKWLLKANGRLN